MRLRSLALRGLTTYTRPDPASIDFDALGPGLIAVVGSNGAGKSTLLEAVPAVLHKSFPTRPGSLYGYASGRDAFIEAVFADGPRELKARVQLDAARRSGTVVVCDVSRSVGPAAEAMVAAADLVVLITSARVVGALAAARTAEWAGARNPNTGLVVRGPAPGGLRGADVADVVGIPLLAAMRAQPGLAEALEHGGLRVRRRSPLTTAADAVLAVVGLDRASSRWAA